MLRSRPILLLALASSLALAPPNVMAGRMVPPIHREISQEMLIEGDTAFDRGDFKTAISRYRDSYFALTDGDRASYLGSIPIRKAMEAFDRAVAQERDPKKRRLFLQRQSALLTRFLLEVQARAGATDEIGKNVIAELEATQRAVDDALAAAQRNSVDPFEAPPERELIPHGELHEPAEPVRDRVGLGLTIGGGILLATGLGLLGGAWSGDDFRVDGDTEREGMLIAGSVVTVIGVTTTLAGAAHLVVHRRRSTTHDMALHVVPFSSPTAGGLVLHGRF